MPSSKQKILHSWSGLPDRDRHPAYHTTVTALIVDPTNTYGYVKIHKCGSNTFSTWLRTEDRWKRAWPRDSRVWQLHRNKESNEPNPNPSEIIVVIRDPAERYFSAVGTMAGFQYDPAWCDEVANFEGEGVYTRNMNQHFWPYTWFTWQWDQFADRMQCVDLKEATAWFQERGSTIPSERHNNKTRDKDKIREHLDTPELRAKLREFYKHDYALLEEHGYAF